MKTDDSAQVKKFLSILLLLVLLAIPLFLSTDIRNTSAELPATDSFAENTVRAQLQQQIAQQMQSQNPLLAQQPNFQTQINAQVEDYIQQNSAQYNQQIEGLSQSFRSQFQHDDGQTYLIALDPYYYFRFVRNIVETGIAGEYLNEDGESVSNFGTAPTEVVYDGNNLHTQFSVYWHKFINLFSDTPIHTTFFFVPVVIMFLATLSAFFLGRKLGGNVSGFSAAMIIGLHTVILSRTIAGFSDTDAYNILFPVLIVWMIVESFQAKKQYLTYLFASLAGLVTGIFAYAWDGWWFIFAIIGLGFALSVLIHGAMYIYTHYMKLGVKKVTRKQLFVDFKSNIPLFADIKSGITYLITSAFFVILFTNLNRFLGAFTGPFRGFGDLDNAAQADLWPNVLTTVAELNNSTFAQTISASFGVLSNFAFWMSLLGIASYSIYQVVKKKNITGNIIILVWLLITVYMANSGVRFIMLYVTAFAIAFALLLGYTSKFLTNHVSKWLEMPPITGHLVMTLGIVLLFFVIPIQGSTSFVGTAQAQAEGAIPSMDDGFYNLLINIKDNSEPDAIISSWWDFGHQFITIAERGATGDGTTQRAKSTIWLGKALVESDPDQFIGISRMLNCGSNQAYEEIFAINEDPTESIDILRSLFDKDKAQAQTILSEQFDANQTAVILSKTHCDDVVESFWIASEDMIGKAPVWGHFGLWDFERSKAWALRRNAAEFDTHVTEKLDEPNPESLRAQLLQMNEEQANAWIAPWPRYITGPGPCSTVSGLTTCQINAQLQQNLILRTITFDGSDVSIDIMLDNQQTTVNPQVYTAVVDGEFVSKSYDNSTLPFGVSLIPSGTSYNFVLMDAPLTESMFTRMYFYDGFGLESYVEKFDQRDTITGQTFKVFKRVQ